MRLLERNGVKVEGCPQCRSGWLDQGEWEAIKRLHGSGPLPSRGRSGSRLAVDIADMGFNAADTGSVAVEFGGELLGKVVGFLGDLPGGGLDVF